MSSPSSSMMLIGVGGSGCRIARGVERAFGAPIRRLLVDTDVTSADEGEEFVLLGGERLAGRGAAGNSINARLAAEESISALADSLEGVRLAAVATSLGGGTGSGATLEILRYLRERGIVTILFATEPFPFESEERKRNANGAKSMLADAAHASFFLPLERLVYGIDSVEEARRQGLDALASAVTLFWRLVDRPGYLRLDAERVRHLVASAGRGRFAVASAQGADRALSVVDTLSRSPLLAPVKGDVQSVLCGVLAGEDLRLSELGTITSGIRRVFGEKADLELATVNDEVTFCGRLCVVAMMFEGGNPEPAAIGSVMNPKKPRNPLATGVQGRGRFSNSARTFWHDEDLDVPTYLRLHINLD